MTPFRTVLIFGFLSLLGMLSVPFLSVDYIPVSGSQFFTISAGYPGKPPLIVEQEVVAPMENHLSQLEELVSIRSVSNYGSGSVTLEFAAGADLAFREVELSALLRQLHPTLPTEVSFPLVSRRAASDKEKSPLMIYEFVYEGDAVIANNWLTSYLLPRVSSLPSLEKVVTSGNSGFAWNVAFDPQKIRRLGIGPDQIVQRVRTSLGNTEIGMYHGDNWIVPVRYENPILTSRDLAGVVIRPDVRLQDIATIAFVPDRIQRYVRVNGRNAIFLSFFPHEGVNRLAVADEIRGMISGLSDNLPPGYMVMPNYDDTEFLTRELDKTWLRAILSLVVISFLILLVSRNWRYLLVLVASIIVSMAITAGVAFLFGVDVHLYTLAGITISAGIIVDNAIVLIDHLKKYRNLSILPAQLASALTTIAALLVIFTLPEEYRKDLSDFALIISLAMGVSFLTSWWFSPAVSDLAGLSGKQQPPPSFTSRRQRLQWLQTYHTFLEISGRYRWIVILAAVLTFGLPVFLLPSKWDGQEWYNRTLGSDHYQEHLRPYVNRILGGSLRLFYQEVYERSGYRTPEKTRLYLTARLPYGHTLEQMNDLIKPAESYLQGFDEIDKFITRVSSPRYASIVIDFKDKAAPGSFPFMLKSRLIQRSLDWGGVNWSVFGVGRGFSNASHTSLPNFRITLKGYHFDRLEELADKLAKKLLVHKRIQEVNTNAQLSWDQESYATYRFQPDMANQPFYEYAATLEQLQMDAPQDFPAAYVNYQDKYFPIYVESADANDMSLFRAMNAGDDRVALSRFGTLIREVTVDAVHKEDRQYLRVVAFDYFGSYRFGDQYLKEVLADLEQDIPPGFSIERRQWSWFRDQEKRRYELILVLMVVVFFIGAIFLEDLKESFFLVPIIPLSFIGLFLIFGWGNFSFDQGGYAAFLLIGGLSVNALLYVLSDYKNYLKRYPHNKALYRALIQKAWPVCLTVLSTCAGLVPFLIHGETEVFWFSFAMGTIGGLLFSLVVVFWILPALMYRKAAD